MNEPTYILWLIGMLGLGLVLLALWGLPKWQAARPELTMKERVELENEARKTLAEILGGAAVLAGLLFTWENLRITQEMTTRNLAIIQEGQVTERFTKAIDHLGAVNDKGEKQLEIRLGAIYALERIARDSERDHWPIMEILTAYVRQHAPWPPKAVPPQRGVPLPAKDQPLPKLAPDVQAILTVLGRRARTFGHGEDEFKNQTLDLEGTDLRGADLRDAHLEWASLGGANLERANLGGAYLASTYFGDTNLERAFLLRASSLTVEQLCGASTLHQASVDLPLTELIRKQCPQRLEKPK